MEKIKISNKTGARLKGIHRRTDTTVPYKRNHGITLIALVITIIILLILAGITINLTLGEHGIIKMAEKAGKNYVNSAEEEQKKLGGLWNEAENIINGTGNGNNPPTIPPFGTIIKTQNNINYTADGKGNTIPVPVGFTPLPESNNGYKDTGFVIKNDSDNNEFVWVPVDNRTTYQYERLPFTRTGWTWSENLDTTTGGIWYTNNSQTYTYTETMPTIEVGRTELDSVNQYGGYYIGRYEAGILSTIERTSSSGISDAVVVQKRKKCI